MISADAVRRRAGEDGYGNKYGEYENGSIQLEPGVARPSTSRASKWTWTSASRR